VGFVIVFAISIAVGVLVYRVTGGEGSARNTGFEPEASSDPLPTPPPMPQDVPEDVREWSGVAASNDPVDPDMVQLAPGTAVPVVGTRLSWHSRLGGVLGLIVAVGIGAVAVALAAYAAGSMLARLVGVAG
jgi:hypothetical protein